MTVSISEEMGEFIRQSLSDGRYRTPEGLVEDALNLLRERSQRARLSEEIAAYAERHAGSALDLDDAIEAGLKAATDLT